MSMYNEVQKKRLENFKKKAGLSDPDELDKHAWKELWMLGISLEGTWATRDSWHSITDYNEKKPKLTAFTHGKNAVKFRRKK